MNSVPIAFANLWQRLAATPTAYVLLWTGLVAVGVACVVLYRTRWGQAQPLRKCAVLSLFVHLLLAGLAMMVKFVVSDGGDGGGGGGPIRIRIIDGGSPTADVAMMDRMPTQAEFPTVQEAAAPPIQETILLPDEVVEPNQEIVVPPTSPAPVEPTPPPKVSIAPTIELTPTAEIRPDANPVFVETKADAGSQTIAPIPNPNDDVRATPQTPMPQLNTGGDASSYPQTPHGSDAAVPGAGLAPPPPGDPYAGRTAGDRFGLVESQGGSRETEAAVVAALGWLASAQSPDGHWDAARFGAGVERKVLGEDRQGAGRSADTGITALALLSFLGAGHTHVSGDYRPTVERGLAYLLRTQANDGSLFGRTDLYSQMYCHSMATFALAEAQAMTGDRRLADGVSKAVGFSVRAQDPVTGGWRYRPLDQGDTSQLGWQVMALASGERAGVAMPLATWSGIDRFLRSVRRGQAGGLASYRPGSLPSTSMTAEAFYCRSVLTTQAGGSIDERASSEAMRQIMSEIPASHRVNLYYWYYATLALHQHKGAGEEAAAAWRAWNEALTSVLVAGQETGGPLAGSWAPDHMWGGYGGRVFSTALSAMCLEVYYRYAPPQTPRDRPEIVTRPGYPLPAR